MPPGCASCRAAGGTGDEGENEHKTDRDAGAGGRVNGESRRAGDHADGWPYPEDPPWFEGVAEDEHKAGYHRRDRDRIRRYGCCSGRDEHDGEKENVDPLGNLARNERADHPGESPGAG